MVASSEYGTEGRRRDKRHAVCLRCAARGFSTRDVEPYPCMECGELGHLSFARLTLNNYKRRGRRLQLECTQWCTRHDGIETKLKDKKAIRCTCRGQQHSYANEKCKLFPKKAGEKRWPGSNLEGDMEVTLQDFQFCERMRSRKQRRC